MKQRVQRLLLHPKTTLAAMIAGLASLAAGLIATIISLRSIDDLDELQILHPYLIRVDLALGIVAAACLILCAIGRSILVFVDDDVAP
jgi:hypothetical protein